VAILGTVLISGALAAVHLYRALFPQHKDAHPGPEPAGGDRVPPRRHVSHGDAAAGGYERGPSR
jgi:hypothetical protein